MTLNYGFIGGVDHDESIIGPHALKTLSYGLLLVHALVAYPLCATCGKHFEQCGAGQTFASSLTAQAMYRSYVCLLEA